MKKIGLIFILSFTVKFSISQNKKEQIIILQNRIDSIKTVYENEILNKKKLSANIDSITKSIVNEYKRIKDIEELNKNLKNRIDINNKEHDSLQSIIQKYNIQILEVKKELLQIAEALKKEKEENEKAITLNSENINLQKSDEVIFTVKLVLAECGDWCYYDFKDVSSGRNLILSWNVKWSEQTGNTYPGIDSESAKIISLFENCANQTKSICPKVLNKNFVVKAIKKTREETIAIDGESREKTGNLEIYYEIKNIRYE